MGIFDFLRAKKKSSEKEEMSPSAVVEERKIPEERELPLETKIPEASPKAPHSPKIKIACSCCDGQYKIREGKYGIFAGCSRFPFCKSTLSLPDLVLKYIETHGIGLYCWERVCWRCGEKTKVYSYYLDYELHDLDELFGNGGPLIGLGDLSYVDALVSKEIPSIKECYSKTTKSKYMANTCQHCGVLQGRNYVVDDPHEIIAELWMERGMGKFFYKTIEISDSGVLKEDMKRLFGQ